MAGGAAAAQNASGADALRGVQAVGDVEPLGAVVRRRLSARIGSPGRTTPSRITRAYIRLSAGCAAAERRPKRRSTNECRIVRHGLAGPDSSSMHLVADASRVPTRQRRHVEPRGGEVLAGRARGDRMALGGDSADGLDA